VAYQLFYQYLLKDWGVRTDNPWEASLFYVPALTYFWSGGCLLLGNVLVLVLLVLLLLLVLLRCTGLCLPACT
jgi:hypothetical protein